MSIMANHEARLTRSMTTNYVLCQIFLTGFSSVSPNCLDGNRGGEWDVLEGGRVKRGERRQKILWAGNVTTDAFIGLEKHSLRAIRGDKGHQAYSSEE
jgi:hypothetical protein